MNTRFEGAWSDIRRQLLPGTLVRYWSAEEGYVGGAFRVNDVDGAAVIVSFGQAGQERPDHARPAYPVFNAELWALTDGKSLKDPGLGVEVLTSPRRQIAPPTPISKGK